MSCLEVFGPSARLHGGQVWKQTGATCIQRLQRRPRPAYQVGAGIQERLISVLKLVVDIERGSQRLSIEFCHTEGQYRSKSYVRASIWNTKNEPLGRFDWKSIPTVKPLAIPRD